MARIPYHYLLALPAAALLACSGAPERDSAELPQALQQDLELARASSMELASATNARTQVVSGLEAGREGTGQGDRAPQPVPTPRARTQQAPAPRHSAQQTAQLPTPDVADEVEAPASDIAEVPAPVAEELVPEPEPTPEPVPEPAVVAVPQSTADGVGDSRARDPGGWGDAGSSGRAGDDGGWGGLGGAILRGGSIGDDDHCEIRPRGGRVVGRGFPSGGTVFIPTPGGNMRTGSTVIRSRGGSSGGGSVASPGRARTRGG